MVNFWLKIAVYFVCFLFSLYGLSALDFNRFLKQGKTAQAQILCIILAMILAYLLGEFIISITYFFGV